MICNQAVNTSTYEKRKPNLIDAHIGSRIRQRRTLLGIKPDQLGEAIGLTYQQVQKYERGTNRIPARRLYDLSQALNVPISYFYDDMPEEITHKTIIERRHADQPPIGIDKDVMTSRLSLELVRNFHHIPDDISRKAAFDLIKAMARAESFQGKAA